MTRIHGLMTPEKARERAVELFKALSLPLARNHRERYPHQVSGGQLQRLAAAMALIGGPEARHLRRADDRARRDDPDRRTESLQVGDEGRRYCRRLRLPRSRVVAQIADRIVVLKGGEVQEEGTTVRHPFDAQARLHAGASGRVRAEGNTICRQKRTDKAHPLLEIENVIAGYGPIQADGLPFMTAVRSVSLSVEKGRNLGIIGESGCGSRRSPGPLPASCRQVPGISFSTARNSITQRAPAITRRAARNADRLSYADTALTPPSPSRTFSGPPFELLSRPVGQGPRRPRG